MANSSFFGTSGTTASVTNTIQTSVDAAATSATNAETAKTAAQTAQAAAEAAQAAASSSQSASATSATASATSATNSATSATASQAAQAASEGARDTASSHKDAAAASETNSAASATSSAASATAAASSASSASSSQTAAAASLASFQGQYSTGTTDPTTNLDAGDLFYNQTQSALKVYTGNAWEQGITAGSGFLPTTGGGLTGNLQLNNASLIFEGSTADANETTVTATDPTADRTITLPDKTGTVVTVASDGTTGQLLRTDGSGNYSFVTVQTNLSGDSNPTLSGNLDVGTNDIVSSSNNDISLLPNGSGKVIMDGNGSTGGISITDGLMEMRSGNSSPAQIDLYCEVSNAHKVSIKAPPHANYSGNVNFTLPAGNGSNGQFLQTDGSGNLSYATVAQPSNATTSTAGLMSATDKTKMDGIETAATADQTITAGGGLSGGGSGDVTISHADTSSQASSNNSGRTYIQDITLDTYGHVTGLATATETATSANNSTVTVTAGTNLNGGGSFDTNQSSGSSITINLSADHRFADNTDSYFGNSHEYIRADDGNQSLRFYTSNAEEMRLESDGDLHVDRNVTAYSTTVSDPRLKTDIEPVTDALSKVEQLNGYTFTYKHDGIHSAGVISTEVADVLPSAIKQSTLPLVTDHDNETLYDIVQYDQLHALLIEAVKELSARVKELEDASTN